LLRLPLGISTMTITLIDLPPLSFSFDNWL
jgi:hypothetical protein